MQVHCSNCNTAHNISHEELKRLKEPVINCSGCDKKIKIQFCPGCGAFYSVTFSNIQPGSYRYKCRKCGIDFQITIPVAYTVAQQPGSLTSPRPVSTTGLNGTSKETGKAPAPVPAPASLQKTAPSESTMTFMQNSINTFTVSELLSIAGTSFSIKKILPSAMAAIIMLLLVRITAILQGTFYTAGPQRPGAGYLVLSLLPAALMLSFYMVAASVVSKVTLERIFHNIEPDWDAIAVFAVKRCPGIFTCNIALLLLVSLVLALFGKIPLLGPVLFSMAFLPVYLFSLLIALLLFTGIWFYPPVTAHRESGLFINFKDLLLFTKKHNLTLLYMIPVTAALVIVAFAAVFIIHSFALALTITVSKAMLSGDASAIFSGIPVAFIKTSEAAFSGINSSVFRELSSEVTIIHRIAGLILGTSVMLITVLLVSIFFSITATVSTHVYIMMERGLTVDDKRKALTMVVLFMFLALLVMLRKVV